MEPSMVDKKINLILHSPLNRPVHSCHYHAFAVGGVHMPILDSELDFVDCSDKWGMTQVEP